MPKFLIEVPHDADPIACARVVKVFLSTGSHFLTNAEWGCKDGVHSCWLMVDMNDKSEALMILPPLFRGDAKITGVGRLTMSDVDATIQAHQGSSAEKT